MSQRPAHPVSRHSTDVGPVQLSYLAAGPESGELVVCLHGIPASAELWRDVVERLAAEGYRVLAPDLPGYGGTRVPANGDRSLAAAAELVADWLSRTGRGPAWVVGHDLGGGVAQILVARHPRHVARLSLSDTVSGDNWPVRPIALSRAVARTGLYPLMGRLRLVPNPYVSWELRRAFADAGRLTQRDRDRVFWDGKVRDPRGRMEFAEHLRSLDNAQTSEVVDVLSRVDVPVQLIWAMQDPHLPWSPAGERLRDAFERGRGGSVRVDLIEDAGHFVPLERPDAFADALLAWRSSVS